MWTGDCLDTKIQIMEDSAPIKSSGYSTKILAEVNLLRCDPSAYVAKLRAHEATFVDDYIYFKESENLKIKTKQGLTAVKEAIELLLNLEPLHPLKFSLQLENAAHDHVKDQCCIKNVGHIGTDGTTPSDRVRKYGEWSHRIGENIRVHMASAEEMVVGWVISDGSNSRESRLNILNTGELLMQLCCPFYICN